MFLTNTFAVLMKTLPATTPANKQATNKQTQNQLSTQKTNNDNDSNKRRLGATAADMPNFGDTL